MSSAPKCIFLESPQAIPYPTANASLHSNTTSPTLSSTLVNFPSPHHHHHHIKMATRHTDGALNLGARAHAIKTRIRRMLGKQDPMPDQIPVPDPNAPFTYLPHDAKKAIDAREKWIKRSSKLCILPSQATPSGGVEPMYRVKPGVVVYKVPATEDGDEDEEGEKKKTRPTQLIAYNIPKEKDGEEQRFIGQHEAQERAERREARKGIFNWAMEQMVWAHAYVVMRVGGLMPNEWERDGETEMMERGDTMDSGSASSAWSVLKVREKRVLEVKSRNFI